MDVTVASRTGRSRPASEDRWVAVTGGSGLLLAVADGMGGTVDGAAAATAALAALVDRLDLPGPAANLSAPTDPTTPTGLTTSDRNRPAGSNGAGSNGAGPSPLDVRSGEPDLAGAVAAAHDRVRALATAGIPMPLRPGTTLTAALVIGRRLHLAHLGDSSCWLLRRGRLRRLTEEHTSAAALVAAGAVQPGSPAQRRLDGMLTRYVGMPGTACPQLTTVRLRAGDRLLLATDGVTRPLPMSRLAALLAAPGTDAAELVQAATEAGGRDDATAILATLPVDSVVPEQHTQYVAEGVR